MCLYPKLIKNRKYTKTKKNKGVIPQVKDQRALWVPVGCGNCIECRKQKAREWQVRLHEEIRERNDGRFVTLSFSDESLTELEGTIKGLSGYNLDNEIATKAIRRFLERWRKKYKKSVRHWLVTELGQNNTERIHIHGLLFTDCDTETIEKLWKYGNVWIGDYVNERTINYIVKYISKTDEKHPNYKSKICTSAGIGKAYIKRRDCRNNEYVEKATREYYKTRSGIKLSLPIYYRNNIYTEEEREKLWLEKLDKEERYVLGQKVSVKDGKDEDYYKLLEVARMKNRELGYGDNEVNWEKRRYENNRRDMLKKVRKRGNKE